jgi:uncharacterized protein (TIGR03067 family)
MPQTKLLRPPNSIWLNSTEFMKNTKSITRTLTIALSSIVILVFGCSKAHNPDSVALQGTWSGLWVGHEKQGAHSLVLAGTTFEYHGARPDDWEKATFSLREDTTPKQLDAVVTDCPAPDYVGKTIHMIYKINDGKLTLAANKPGNLDAPESFDAQGTRIFVFTKK